MLGCDHPRGRYLRVMSADAAKVGTCWFPDDV
jgi:hypothetical protein